MKIEIYDVSYTDIETIQKVQNLLVFLKQEYPNFLNWYKTKVQPGLKNKSRRIIIATPAKYSSEVAAIMILKDTIAEKKISTLCVMKNYRAQGLGTVLLNLAMTILDTDSPLITVSEFHIDEFKPLLNRFKYECYKEYKNYYKDGISEYSYNGYLNESNEANKNVG